jgi:hypothetical protein
VSGVDRGVGAGCATAGGTNAGNDGGGAGAISVSASNDDRAVGAAGTTRVTSGNVYMQPPMHQ